MIEAENGADVQPAATAAPQDASSQHASSQDLATKLGLCSSCGEPAALKCNGCREAPTCDGTVTTHTIWYCSKGCQKEHWSIHKNVCKKLQQRIQVHYAGKLVRDIWLVFRRNTWNQDIELITTCPTGNSKYIMMLAGSFEKHFRTRYLWPFPDSLTSDPLIKNACLVYGMAREALVFLRPVLEKLLQGM